jgi:hypothetical protein
MTNRTAVYGPVRTVVWEGRSREAPPYPNGGVGATGCDVGHEGERDDQGGTAGGKVRHWAPFALALSDLLGLRVARPIRRGCGGAMVCENAHPRGSIPFRTRVGTRFKPVLSCPIPQGLRAS